MAISRPCQLHFKFAIICLFSCNFFLNSESLRCSSGPHAVPLLKSYLPLKRKIVLSSRLTIRGGDDGNLKESTRDEGPTSADITKIKKNREKSMTRSSRAGLQFPVGRLARFAEIRTTKNNCDNCYIILCIQVLEGCKSG